MSSKTKAPKTLDLGKHAEGVRKELAVPQQNEIFRAAVEAGYLAALADGEVDEAEKRAIIDAIGILSVGAVIEWEADTLVEECATRIAGEGIEERVTAVGAVLKRLGHPEAGLLFAAFVAQATGGIDDLEKGVLEAVAEAAGIPEGKLGGILKKAKSALG